MSNRRTPLVKSGKMHCWVISLWNKVFSAYCPETFVSLSCFHLIIIIPNLKHCQERWAETKARKEVRCPKKTSDCTGILLASSNRWTEHQDETSCDMHFQGATSTRGNCQWGELSHHMLHMVGNSMTRDLCVCFGCRRRRRKARTYQSIDNVFQCAKKETDAFSEI